MKKNNKGFTLMEMLIVVAIIGVLVAIMIPTISSNLTKAKQAKDAANVRAAYAEVSANFLLEESPTSKNVDVEVACDESQVIGGMTAADSASAGVTYQKWTGAGTVTVDASGENGEVSITFTAKG